MAKKLKANKTVSKVLKFVDFAAIVLGLVAIFMFFVPALVHTQGDYTANYSGWDVAFGKAFVKDDGATIPLLNFSFMNLLPYILLVAGVVLLVLNCFGKGVKFLYFICAACFVAAAIFFFCAFAFTLPAEVDGASGLILLANGVLPIDMNDCVLGAGPVISAICSIIAGVGCVGKIVFKD